MAVTILTFSATSAYGYSEPLERLKASLDNFGLGDLAYSDKIDDYMVSTLVGIIKQNKDYTHQRVYNIIETLSPKKPNIDWNDARRYVRSAMTPTFDKNQYKIMCGSVSLKYIAACLGPKAYHREAVYLRGVEADDIDVDWIKGNRYPARFLEANRENLSTLGEYYLKRDIVAYRSQILQIIENNRLKSQHYNEALKRQENAEARARAQKNKTLYEAERRQRARTENKASELQQVQKEQKPRSSESENTKNRYQMNFKVDFSIDAHKNLASFDVHKDGYTIDDQCRISNRCSGLTYTLGAIHPFTKGYKRWDIEESNYPDIAQTLGLKLNEITGIKLMAHHENAFIAFKYNKIWFVHELTKYISDERTTETNKKLTAMWEKYSDKIGIANYKAENRRHNKANMGHKSNATNSTAENTKNKYQLNFKTEFSINAHNKLASFDITKDSYTIDDQCEIADHCGNLTYTLGRIHPFTEGYKRWDIKKSDYPEIAQTLGLTLNKITGIKLMAYHGDAFIAFRYNKVWFVHKLKDHKTYRTARHIEQKNTKLVGIWDRYAEKVGVTYIDVINGVQYYSEANPPEFIGIEVGKF